LLLYQAQQPLPENLSVPDIAVRAWQERVRIWSRREYLAVLRYMAEHNSRARSDIVMLVRERNKDEREIEC
jgi:hypothetical protein